MQSMARTSVVLMPKAFAMDSYNCFTFVKSRI